MSQGLRFECQPGCTECCTQRGFVYLTEADVERAAAFLEMTPGAFEQKYVFRSKLCAACGSRKRRAAFSCAIAAAPFIRRSRRNAVSFPIGRS